MKHYIDNIVQKERDNFKGFRNKWELCPSDCGFFRPFSWKPTGYSLDYTTLGELRKQIRSLFLLPLYPIINLFMLAIISMLKILSMLSDLLLLDVKNIWKDFLWIFNTTLGSILFTPITLLAAIAAPISLITRSLASITCYSGDPYFEYSHLVTGDKPL